MTDDTPLSRRTTLKVLGGLTGGSLLGSQATAATTTHTPTVDDSGREKWVLRFENAVAAANDSNPSISEVKEVAGSIKRQTLSKLEDDDRYTVKNDFWLANAALVSAEPGQSTAKQGLESLEGVERVHPDFAVPSPEPVTTDELVGHDHGSYQYGVAAINAPHVWEAFGTRGDGVSVAVLDTGIDPDHPDLEFTQDRWAGFGPAGSQLERSPYDRDGHGTHVSGTVAGGRASGLDSAPHLGVAPNVDLYNVKVLDNGGTFTQILAGVEWAVEQGIDVINMSLGATGTFPEMIEPIQNAVTEGTVVVSSAGNSGAGSSGSPGNIYESFAVGATDNTGDVTGFSSGERINTSEDWGADWLTEPWPINYYVPNISAPGADVLSTYPNGEYRRLSGTSMASPHVAGAVALAISADSELRGDVSQIKELFETTAVHGDGPEALPDSRYGDGVIDTLSGVTAATDGTTVSGTLTNADGTPLEGITVESSFGTTAETADDGSFSLLVADGEWELTADAFGYQPATATIQASGGTVSEDLSLADGLDVLIDAGQPDVIGRGETFDITLEAANLEAFTVSLADTATVTADDVSLSVDGTSVPLGDTFSLPEPVTGTVQLTVEMAEDAATDTLALTHEFSGPGSPITATTGPTDVLVDPADASVSVIEWDETTEVSMGQTLTTSITVENTGDRTITTPLQWWLFDPQGQNVFTADVVTLEGGEQASAEFPIQIPANFVPPGQTGSHGWIAGEQTVSVTAEFFGSAFALGELSAPEQVDRGEPLSLTVPYQNAGNAAGSATVDLTFDGVLVGSQSISADPSASGTATLTFDTGQVVRDQYEYTLSTGQSEVSGSVWVGPIQAPPAVIGSNRPRDLTGDGLYEDINGNGEADILDVQALYSNLDSPAVQENSEYYNFAGDDPTEVSIVDVQALYNRV
jgi:subtilisin family serine protease